MSRSQASSPAASVSRSGTSCWPVMMNGCGILNAHSVRASGSDARHHRVPRPPSISGPSPKRRPPSPPPGATPASCRCTTANQITGTSFSRRPRKATATTRSSTTATLSGFAASDRKGRVAGQPAGSDNLLDLGGGIRPDLVGRGLGAAGLAAVLTYARDRFSPPGFRTAIASFNRRSVVLCRWAGFRTTTTFQGPGGREFTELVLVEPAQAEGHLPDKAR